MIQIKQEFGIISDRKKAKESKLDIERQFQRFIVQYHKLTTSKLHPFYDSAKELEVKSFYKIVKFYFMKIMVF